MRSKVNGGKKLPIYLFRRDASPRTAGAISKSAGGYAIADTSTTAKVGDIYRAESSSNAVMVYKEYSVIEASTNSFTIASKELPVIGDTFYILGKTTLRAANDGSPSVSVTSGTITSISSDFASSASVTTVAYNAASTSALGSNSSRKGALFYNNTDGYAYVLYGSGTADTTSNFSVIIGPAGFYNMPKPIYTGAMKVIFSGGTAGNLLITEL